MQEGLRYTWKLRNKIFEIEIRKITDKLVTVYNLTEDTIQNISTPVFKSQFESNNIVPVIAEPEIIPEPTPKEPEPEPEKEKEEKKPTRPNDKIIIDALVNEIVSIKSKPRKKAKEELRELLNKAKQLENYIDEEDL